MSRSSSRGGGGVRLPSPATGAVARAPRVVAAMAVVALAAAAAVVAALPGRVAGQPGPIPPPPIREFSSAQLLGSDSPRGAGVAEDGQPETPPLPGEAAPPEDERDPAAAGLEGAGKKAAAGEGAASPLALPDPYLDPSWPDLRPPLEVERRRREHEAAEAERVQSGEASQQAEQPEVPLAEEDLYMKEAHEDVWDEDFRDHEGNPTGAWDPDYEDPKDW